MIRVGTSSKIAPHPFFSSDSSQNHPSRPPNRLEERGGFADVVSNNQNLSLCMSLRRRVISQNAGALYRSSPIRRALADQGPFFFKNVTQTGRGRPQACTSQQVRRISRVPAVSNIVRYCIVCQNVQSLGPAGSGCHGQRSGRLQGNHISRNIQRIVSFFAVAYLYFIVEPKTKTRYRRKSFEISCIDVHALIWLVVLITSLGDVGVKAHFMDCRSNPGSTERHQLSQDNNLISWIVSPSRWTTTLETNFSVWNRA